MSTARPLPAHGTYARSVGRPSRGIKGCSCPPCREARNRYKRRRSLLNSTGRNLTVPAGPATAHLQYLKAAGAGWLDLATATGCSGSTISHILRGHRTTLTRTVATAILRIQLTDVLAPGRPTPTLGSIRRIHALMALGHRSTDIATACGVDNSLIVHLTNEHLATVRADTAQKIHDGYGAILMTIGPSVRNRRRALREGWAPPLAWDDIDNPDCEPDTSPEPTVGRGELAELRRNDVEHLAAFGIPNAEIAERVGLAVGTVRELVLAWRTDTKRDRKKTSTAA